MKKAIIAVLLIVLIVIAIPTFVACDEQDDTVTVTIHNSNSRPIVIEKQKGDTITFREYGEKTSNLITGTIDLGLYVDKECKVKYNEDTKLDKDITLYVDYRVLGSERYTWGLMTFVFNGENHSMFKALNEPLTSTDFAITAYGKPVDSSKLKYYSDEEMTDELDIEGKTLDELFPEHPFDETPTVEIYVKQVE